MRPPLRLPALALPLLALASVARAAPDPPLDAAARDFDQVHIVVRVTPRIAEGVVDGDVVLTFLSLSDALGVVRLHCQETQVLRVEDGNGARLDHLVADDVLSIRLAAPLARGAGGTVRVLYRSRPTAGLFFHAPTKDDPSTPLEMYSQGEGTDNRRWIPCYDEPDDRLTCEVLAVVPADLRTVSNGILVGSREAGPGLREDHWRLEQRIPSYLISLIVGRFETVTEMHGTIPLEYNGPPGRAAEVRQGCSGTPAMMRFFEEYLAAPYPYPRYAQTTVWDFVYGGMENASATTMNMRLLHGPQDRPNYSSDGLVAHELAHQWFGDLLTCRTWDHLWLNEGFATYFTDLFHESRDGGDEFALRRRSQNRGYMDKNRRPDTLGLKRSPRGDVPLELFGGKQYDRGAAILHQARLELGDDTFRAGMRRYVREHADRAVVSEDLRRSMEAEARRDLSWFFDQWVYGAGYPVLKVSARFGQGANASVATVTVEQTQTGGGGQAEAFRIALPIRFGAGEGAVRRVLDVRRRVQEFQVTVDDGDARRWLRAGDGGGTFARIEVLQDRAAWEAMLAGDPDPTGRLDAVEALRRWPDGAIPALTTALVEDRCHAVRQEAAEALGDMAGSEPLEALLAASGDTDARVREAVARALGGRTAAESTAALRAFIEGDPSPYVRAAAARSLGRVRADGAFELLAGLLRADSHRETVRAGALDGLAALGDSRAAALARPLLRYEWPRGDHNGMRESALRVLLAYEPDEPTTRAALVRLLDDPYHRTREHAARMAGHFAVREALPRLRTLAKGDAFASVKRAAEEAVKAVETPPKSAE